METHHFDEALLASTIYTPQKKLNEYDINQQNQSIHTHQKKKIEKGNDLHQQWIAVKLLALLGTWLG